MFVTLRFDILRPANSSEPGSLWRHLPVLASGIVAFDLLVANSDRHRMNIKVDRPEKPSHVHLFDHDRALFYCVENQGKQWLRSHRDDPTIGTNHCLPPMIDSNEHFNHWFGRIEGIPDWFLEEICRDARGFGITQTESQAAVDFLMHRRDNIVDLFQNALPLFPPSTKPLLG